MADDKSSPKRLPALLIDFSQPLDYNIVYPLSPATKANSLQQRAKESGKSSSPWNAEAIRLVDAQHGLYRDIPMVCLGKCGDPDSDEPLCEHAKYCPFDDEKVEADYKGGNCPVEVLEAFKLFAGYVVDLEISPTDFTDLQTVVDIVRIHLMIRRCDLYQKDKPIWQNKVGGIYQKTGEVKYDKVIGLGHQMLKELRLDLDKKYTLLVATRLDKMKADSISGQQTKDMATYIANLQRKAESIRKDRAPKKTKPEVPIDAEFKVSDKE